MRPATLAALVAATLLVLCFYPQNFAEADQSKIPDLEGKVGKGWQCFAMPSGFDKVGYIFEQRKDKSVFYVAALDEAQAVTAPAYLGSLSTSKHFSLGAAIQMISAFFPSLNVSYDYQNKTTVVISGAEETVGGEKVTQDAVKWAQDEKNLSNFKRDTRLFVVREAILASGLTYSFDKSTAVAISAQLSLTAPKTGTAGGTSSGAPSKPAAGSSPATGGNAPGQSSTDPAKQSSTDPSKQSSTVSPPNAGNQIAQTFNPKIGICIHPDEIVLGSQFGGPPKAIARPVTEDLDLRDGKRTQRSRD